MSKCKEFRRRAHASLGSDIFDSKFLYAVIIIIILSLIVDVLGFTVLGILLCGGPFAYGMAKAFSRVARGQNQKVDLGSVLIDGFREDGVRNIINFILIFIYTFFWSLLLIIPGIIKSYAYSMSSYILTDNPNISANDAITASRKMMRGRKWKLFCLDLSFIGWYIVGLLCLGVGVFWVEAYKEMAHAHFYEEIKSYI